MDSNEDHLTHAKLAQNVGGSEELSTFAPFIDTAIIVPESVWDETCLAGDLGHWCRDTPHLIALDRHGIGRVCLVLFRVLHYQARQEHGFIQELIIEVIACADSAITEDRQIVIEFIRSNADENLNYRHKFLDVFGQKFDSIEVFLSDMLDRNDGFIDAVINRIALIGCVLCSEVRT